MKDLTGLEVIIGEPGVVGQHGGLVAAALPIEGVSDAPPRWLGGVKFNAFTSTKPTGRRVDLCEVMGNASPGAIGDVQTYHSFEIEMGLACSMLSLERGAVEALTREAVTRHGPALVAAQLERDRFAVGDGSLAHNATNLNNVDQSIAGALFAIEAGLATRLSNARGMVHMPAALLTSLVASGHVIEQDGQFVTAGMKHRVVADAGYLGVSPVTRGIIVNQVWIYGSGAVRLKMSDTVRLDIPLENTNTLGRSENTVRATQQGVLAFDSTTVVAAMIDATDADIVFGS